MKPSPETEILRDENIEMGLIPTADYTSEHELGIKTLQSYLSTNGNADGIERYQCAAERSHYVTFITLAAPHPKKLRGRTV